MINGLVSLSFAYWLADERSRFVGHSSLRQVALIRDIDENSGIGFREPHQMADVISSREKGLFYPLYRMDTRKLALLLGWGLT